MDKLWFEFPAKHEANCQFGRGHRVVLGRMAYSAVEAIREIRLAWPTHTLDEPLDMTQTGKR